jgi:hypothetical protein
LDVISRSQRALNDDARFTVIEFSNVFDPIFSLHPDQSAVRAFVGTLTGMTGESEPTDTTTGLPYGPGVREVIEDTVVSERAMDDTYSDTYRQVLQLAQGNLSALQRLAAGINAYDADYEEAWKPIREILHTAVLGTELTAIGGARMLRVPFGSRSSHAVRPPVISERLWLSMCALMYSGRPVETSCIAIVSALTRVANRALLWKFGATIQEVQWMSNILAQGLGGRWDVTRIAPVVLPNGEPHDLPPRRRYPLRWGNIPARVKDYPRSRQEKPFVATSRLATLLGAPYKADRPNSTQLPYVFPYGQTLELPTFTDDQGRVYALRGMYESEASSGHLQEIFWQEGAEIWLVCWPVPRTSGVYRLPVSSLQDTASTHPSEWSSAQGQFDFLNSLLKESPVMWNRVLQTEAARLCLSLPTSRQEVTAELRAMSARGENQLAIDLISTLYNRHVLLLADPISTRSLFPVLQHSSDIRNTYAGNKEDVFLDDAVDMDISARRREASVPVWRCAIPSFPVMGETLVLAQNRFMWRYDRGAELLTGKVTQLHKTTRPTKSMRIGDECALCCVRVIKQH